MIRVLILAMLLATSHAVCAQTQVRPPVLDAAQLADIARIKARYPETKFESITPTPVRGLYQAILATNRKLFYVDAEGRYFLFGRIFDVERQEDITEPVLASLEAPKVDVATLPLGDAIKSVRGSGERTLYVFSDPECPYCRKLEAELLPEISNVTIYTFVFPMLPTPRGREKAIAVWCAPDREAAWKAVMVSGKTPETSATNCDHPIDRNSALARALKVDGTPTLFSADGRVLRGAGSPERVEAFLNLTKKVAQVAQ